MLHQFLTESVPEKTKKTKYVSHTIILNGNLIVSDNICMSYNIYFRQVSVSLTSQVYYFKKIVADTVLNTNSFGDHSFYTHKNNLNFKLTLFIAASFL